MTFVNTLEGQMNLKIRIFSCWTLTREGPLRLATRSGPFAFVQLVSSTQFLYFPP
ncbi:hypothetical protein Peur_056290 [Populus x canadensis]